MAVLIDDLNRALVDYADRFPQDRGVVEELRALQKEQAQITHRKEFRGHVTCSAICVADDGQVLMIHHRALDRWLFPGGHLEADDSSLRDAALRELMEETGISKVALSAPADEFAAMPVHLDRHIIPENPAKAEPAHPHYDFGFIFVGRTGAVAPQLAEVTDCAWVRREKMPPAIASRLSEAATWWRAE